MESEEWCGATIENCEPIKKMMETDLQYQNLKILLVGNTEFPIYVKAFYDAFCEIGVKNVELFDTNFMKKSGSLWRIAQKIQNKLHVGPSIRGINKRLEKKCKSMQPALVFIYQGINIYPKTIRAIKRHTNAKVFSYNNDDPFAQYYAKGHWRHYRDSIKLCDFNFVYRQKNVLDIRTKYGIEAEIMRSYYLAEKNHPILEEERIETPEVIFLGHYEEDERGEYIQALLNEGLKVGVPSEHYNKFKFLGEGIMSLSNERRDYNKYLASCKIPLIFLSKINHDTYTRRCFEIPAAGAMIFSPYTEDMASMFEEGSEAVYYRNKEDFVNKVKYYLQNETERQLIAQNGRERLLKEGHEVKDRVKQILMKYSYLTDNSKL